MSGITGKTFYDPLLLVLLDKSQGRVGVPVKHSEVYEQAAQEVFPPPSEDWDRISQCVQDAAKALRKKNLMSSPQRGFWALTMSGYQEAVRLRGNKETPRNQIPIEEPTLPQTQVVSGDQYLLSLATEASACFGCFGANSATCKTCEVKPQCLYRQHQEMMDCLQILTEKDHRKTQKEDQQDLGVIKDYVPSESSVPKLFTPSKHPSDLFQRVWVRSDTRPALLHLLKDERCYLCGELFQDHAKVFQNAQGFGHERCKKEFTHGS